MARVFIGQPCYGEAVQLQSCDAVDVALQADSPHSIEAVRLSSSLLANCFNKLLFGCYASRKFDAFVLLHGDVAPSDGWVDTLIAELDAHRLDVIHAPCALKDMRGLTLTALAYSHDPWENVRRLTMTELHYLPETFTINDVRASLDRSAAALLPNTGCMMLGLGEWIRSFPGFTIRDRVVWLDDGMPQVQVISEDWGFGRWAHAAGVRVGCTRKVAVRHRGQMDFPNDVVWGDARDEEYFSGLPTQNTAVGAS